MRSVRRFAAVRVVMHRCRQLQPTLFIFTREKNFADLLIALQCTSQESFKSIALISIPAKFGGN
ncbi:hypothetical protein GUJ93_ZPchr0006g43238 [Zizania palustris]|uniref:Uncharacterized protein n=1 Tax=Zizania palustris TaxID=103762 RepID=A0A8J5W3Y6_ZIZPA|nr:hypothetical protein GUJ93_ZPchr0006g43238 [Zizania palustris]